MGASLCVPQAGLCAFHARATDALTLSTRSSAIGAGSSALSKCLLGKKLPVATDRAVCRLSEWCSIEPCTMVMVSLPEQ